jgi:hypothetical protein
MSLRSRAGLVVFGRACAVMLSVAFLAGCSLRGSGARELVSEPEPIPSESDLGRRSLGNVFNFARELVIQAELHRAADLGARSLTHATLWKHVGPFVDGAAGMHRREIGRSVEGRPLYAVDIGGGPIRVMLWSQMHGDEPTATLALADLIGYIAENPADPVVRRISESLTVAAILMLNPDGAERGRRENSRGIDLNRDARRQASPEARALAQAHAQFSPHFGFNLHDQTLRTGEDGRAVAISLLAPPHDQQHSELPTRTRAKRLAAVVRMAADSLVDGRVTRYEEPYNAQAFGDAMQSWGTSTVLIETGAWEQDAGKEYLRRVNFALLLVALDAIATGSFEYADLGIYESLPSNRTNPGG